jgi:hypothetical protein
MGDACGLEKVWRFWFTRETVEYCSNRVVKWRVHDGKREK